MSTSSALESFLGKWHQRWPEWSLVEPFIAVEHRERCVAWFALLQEFETVYQASGDTTAVDAKLAWWGEELRSWANQRSRHPLGRVLEPVRAPWATLAASLDDLLPAREALVDAGMARTSLASYAAAVADVEAVLFDAERVPNATTIVITQTLAQRLDRTGQLAVPQSLPGEDGQLAIRMWAQTLLRGWPVRAPGPRPRRLLALLSRLRLQGLASEKGVSPHQATVLLKAWWAARGR